MLRISRNTVRKYWDGVSVPWESKDYSREASVLTEDAVAFVRQCLDEDTRNFRKQHTTMVAALIDRLSFRSPVLDMSGDSYRLKAASQKGWLKHS